MGTNVLPDMRSPSEIQRAHDILRAMILGEIPSPFASKEAALAAIDTLCWVLRHDHNQHFAENLKAIEDTAEESGFVLCQDETSPW